MLEVNKFQTQLTEELEKSLDKKVWSQLIEYIETVDFIKWLISLEEIRGYAKDRPKDENGKIIVDITKPHILEDMDFFRERALYFKKHGVYTHLPKNPNPKSAFAEFWKEELRRWKYGLTRPSDGEWIPGGLYFYWNYSQIWMVEKAIDEQGNEIEKKGERKHDFPRPYLGDYLFYHYLEQATQIGKHGKMLKARGIGASFKFASMSPRNMYVYPGSGNPNFHLASDKSFLIGDKGIWGKVIDNLDWLGDHTPLPKMRLIDGKKALELQLGVENEYGTREGLLSSVYGISLKDNPDKARGVRGPLIHYEEDGLFPNLESAWNINREATEEDGIAYGLMFAAGCLTKNNLVWTNSGKLLPINEVTKEDGIVGYNGEIAYKEKIGWYKEPQKKQCVRITTSGGDNIECSVDHPILWSKNHWRKGNMKKGIKNYLGKFCTFKNAGEIKKGDQILKVDNINIFGNKHIEHARLFGLMIGDGNLTKGSTPTLSCSDDEIYQYVKNKYNCKYSKKYITKDGNTYRQLSLAKAKHVFIDSGINYLVDINKRLPENIHEYNKQSLSKLIGGYFDADGNVYYNEKRKNLRVVLTSKVEPLLKQVKLQLTRFGIHSNIVKEYRKDGYKSGVIYRLYITSYTDVSRFRKEIPLLCKHKIEKLNLLDSLNNLDRTREKNYYFKLGENNQGQYFLNRDKELTNTRHETVTKVEFIGEQTIYNLHTTHSNTYLANNFITKQTGGVEGASFEGSEKLFYQCDAYNIYAIPNVFDKNTNGKSTCAFFWGAYLNKGKATTHYNGEVDVIKRLIMVLEERKKIADASNDPKALTQKKAETPITPQEAVMRIDGTIFPVSDLKDYLSDILPKLDSFLSNHYVGDLSTNPDGQIIYKPNADIHILRDYPLKDNLNKVGGFEIFEMPKNSTSGIPPKYRYVAGIDPYDDDHSTTTSLGSMFVFDLLTDRIVAEYTGRPLLANTFYENCYRLLKFYNAVALYENDKKGLFTYFSNKNILHYLADAPQILKDMDIVKATNLFGNKAKGYNSGKIVNAWGRRLQADWMLSKAYGEENKINLHTIRSIGYLKEAISWNIDGNFDRVSAMIGVMILREEYYKHTMKAEENMTKNINNLSVDPFFHNNFNLKGKISQQLKNVIKEKSYNNIAEFSK